MEDSADNEKTLTKLVIPVDGIHCAACAAKIEKKLLSLKGIESVSVHLPTKTVFASVDEGQIDRKAISLAIREIGYKPLRVVNQEEGLENTVLFNARKEKRTYFIRFIGALLFTALLMARGDGFSVYTVWALATVIWAYFGLHFHKGFFNSIKSFSADMNTLVSLSTTVMYVYSSAFVFMSGDFLYKMKSPLWREMAMLVTFINFGRWLEAKLKMSAGKSIASLFKMKPRYARVIDDKGKETLVFASKVRLGDRVVVRPGEQISVDGEVLDGSSSVDESLLTGESVPVTKVEGNPAFAGTLNQTGILKIKVTKTGQDTVLSKIIKIVWESQAKKAQIQNMVDKVSSYFVPTVFFVAILSAIIWFKLSAADNIVHSVNVFVAVLAVACPCAMGLAVPMALLVGFSRAAGMGILIKNADALWRVGKLKTLVMDKTGTITEGKLSVSEVHPIKCQEKTLLKYALTAEQNSEHLFASAIRKYANSKKIKPFTDIKSSQAVPGQGVEVVTKKSGRILAGKVSWLMSKGVMIPAKEHEESQYSVVGISKDDRFCGYILLSDNIKATAKRALAKLGKMNLSLVLLSGDKRAVVSRIAGELGIKRYYGGVLPQDKAKVIDTIKSEGYQVAMVGDGFNDAPALSKADVGISLSTGTDVAIESSDITIMRKDLMAISDSISISRNIKLVTKQNLFWAFGYNTLLIPLAAGALYPLNGFILPVHFAGLAMALSSVSVVLNSLRLGRMKI
jgi:heavy metal translocating P-type ATPase